MEMASIKTNGRYYKEQVPLQGKAFTKKDGFYLKEWKFIKKNFH